MFRQLRRREQQPKVAPDPGLLTAQELLANAEHPAAIRDVNMLPDDAKSRLYRLLLPPGALAQAGIDPVTWRSAGDNLCIKVDAPTQSPKITLTAGLDLNDPFLTLTLTDNGFNGIDLDLIVASDPNAPRYNIDRTPDGLDTQLGATRRNLDAEEQAKAAGLAPAQIRAGAGFGKQMLAQVEVFLVTLAHKAYGLEPLTYASAWVFERRGFAYVRGHKLMNDIHEQFQPGGALHAALDNSTPFRQPDQWNTVRGRAWAIHDGVLDAIDMRWDNLRMIKRIGHNRGATTFPDARY